MTRRACQILLIFAMLGVAGCGGYTQEGSETTPVSGYQWHSLFREDIHTVAVPIFTNRDFHRGVEFALTKAVQNQLEAMSPYKVVAEAAADTVLEGEIVSVNTSTLSQSSYTATPQEQLLTITVNLTWKRLRDGQILMQQKNFTQTSTFYPTLGEAPAIGEQEAVEQLAIGIVQEMQADW